MTKTKNERNNILYYHCYIKLLSHKYYKCKKRDRVTLDPFGEYVNNVYLGLVRISTAATTTTTAETKRKISEKTGGKRGTAQKKKRQGVTPFFAKKKITVSTFVSLACLSGS